MTRLVVIGGGAAGMSAASAARRVDGDLDIVVLEATGFAAWGLCGIPYLVSGVVSSADHLITRTPEEFRSDRRIDLRLHTTAERIDPARRKVRISNGGEASSIGYDRLVVTTGASAARPPLPGLDHERVFTIRSLEAASELTRLVAAGSVRRAVVVGAGYIGLEMADALVERGCDVTVVEMFDRVMPTLDPEIAAEVESTCRRHADLRLASRLVDVDHVDGGLRCRVDDGTHLDADVVVLATGVRPSGGIAAEAGAEVTAQRAVVVDDHMRTSLTDVWAAGDCVVVPHLVLGGAGYVPLGPTANKTGRVAGTVAAGGEARFRGVVGTAVAKIFDLTVARTGLTLSQALEAGIGAAATDVTAGSRAKYYPGSSPTTVRLVHRADGGLLGAQMVSTDPATAKRIDVVATALHAGMDVRDLADLDLSYAPPYAPVYEPILRAAQAAAKSLAVSA